jgi:hypothetical protein
MSVYTINLACLQSEPPGNAFSRVFSSALARPIASVQSTAISNVRSFIRYSVVFVVLAVLQRSGLPIQSISILILPWPGVRGFL